MRRWRSLFAFAAVGAASGLMAAWLALGLPDLGRELRRRLLFAEPLVEIRAPVPDQLVVQGGIEVIVRFPDQAHAAVGSFRCLLNGQDVTESLTRGENGAAGSVVGAVDGANRLRVEIFGEAWWGSTFFEDSDEVTFHVRPFPALDRAGPAGGFGRA